MFDAARRNFLKSPVWLGLASPFVQGAPRRPLQTWNAPGTKITAVRTYVLDQEILVEVATDIGMSGWVECGDDNLQPMEPFVHTSLKDWVIGADPFDNEPLWNLLFYKNHDLGPGEALTNAISKIGIEVDVDALRRVVARAPKELARV